MPWRWRQQASVEVCINIYKSHSFISQKTWLFTFGKFLKDWKIFHFRCSYLWVVNSLFTVWFHVFMSSCLRNSYELIRQVNCKVDSAHTIKAYVVIGGITPVLFNLCINFRWVGSLQPQSLYSPGKKSRWPPDTSLGVHRDRCKHFREQEEPPPPTLLLGFQLQLCTFCFVSVNYWIFMTAYKLTPCTIYVKWGSKAFRPVVGSSSGNKSCYTNTTCTSTCM